MEKRTCTIDGCENAPHARGWCGTHYRRWQRRGDPYARNGAANGEPMEFFLAHVMDETDDCILWPYASSQGYGKVDVDRRQTGVHILSCLIHHGAKPDGHEVCHSCRNRHCFNRRHIRWGTSVSNKADMVRDGTRRHGEGRDTPTW